MKNKNFFLAILLYMWYNVFVEDFLDRGLSSSNPLF